MYTNEHATWMRMTRHCREPKPCVYYIQGTCEYLAIEHRRRPCKPGDACTVKQTLDKPRPKVRPGDPVEATMRKLYDKGHSDPVIAQACNVDRGVVQRWRAKNGLPPNSKGGRPKKEGNKP